MWVLKVRKSNGDDNDGGDICYLSLKKLYKKKSIIKYDKILHNGGLKSFYLMYWQGICCYWDMLKHKYKLVTTVLSFSLEL